jgi:hypothetical protein
MWLQDARSVESLLNINNLRVNWKQSGGIVDGAETNTVLGLGETLFRKFW